MQWYRGKSKKNYLTNNCICENSSYAPVSICLEFMDTRLLWCKDTAVGKALILQKRLMNVWTLKMGTGPSIYHVIRFKCLWKPTPHPILHNIGTAPNLWCPKDVPLNFQNISTPNIFTLGGSVQQYNLWHKRVRRQRRWVYDGPPTKSLNNVPDQPLFQL